jgi:membrane protease YdiL (CAAX protease family)
MSPASHTDVASPPGILTTIGVGFLFGYIFRWTSNIVAPWLAHAIMIVPLAAVGGATCYEYNPG